MINSKLIIPYISLGAILILQNALVYGREWQILKGEHFIVYFEEDKKFAKEVLDRAEQYYRRIAEDLGYTRYSNFWLWENRVKIYIYPDHSAFIKESRQPSWSRGMADYTHKRILSFRGCIDFLSKILPHELTHLIFRDYIGFKGEVPLWLDEGVAMWQEEDKRQEAQQIVKSLLKQHKLLSLKTLTTLDIRRVEDRNLAGIFYMEAISLVGFMIKRYGTQRFIEFCRELRDGKSINEALSFAYPNSISSIEKLEEAWIEYIREENS